MFITFEGGEGSGKTTLIRKISEYVSLKKQTLITREPGGSLISEQIREIILDKNNTNMTYHTEALLYAAARHQHLVEVILPALNSGQYVLCDRFIDSSLAYQGYARHLGFDYILKINDQVLDHMPNLTFFIDVKAEVGLLRIQGRTKIDRLDLEKQEFHEKVRQGYLELAKMYPNRIKVLDGNQSLEALEKQMIEVIKAYE